jgi:hypothetical protein
MFSRTPLLLLVLSFIACGRLEVGRAPARDTQPIVGGTLTTGDPAVVALMAGSAGQAQQFCTGTLIAPRTVLTAAHCIFAAGNVPYAVAFGPDADYPTRLVRVAAQVPHPSYDGRQFDFGIMRLADPVADVAPIPINDLALTTAHVGVAVRHVGYGITNSSAKDSGLKREGVWAVRRVLAHTFESGSFGKQSCSGDSGGPGFMVMPGDSTETIVGVVSYGDSNCTIEGYDGRVDVAATWVRQTMGAWELPTCELDGACLPGCTPVDQDCACARDGQCTTACLDLKLDPDCPRACLADGVCAQQACPVPDRDCVDLGGACMSPISCRDRLCLPDPQHPANYCTRTCTTSADCGPLECAAGTCRYPQLPTRLAGEVCFKSTEFCVDSICTGPAGGFTRCVQACLVSRDCSGSVCEAGADSQRYCRSPGLRFFPVVVPALAQGTASFTAAKGCSTVGGLSPLLGLALLSLRRRRCRRRNRTLTALVPVLALAACTQQPNPPVTTWWSPSITLSTSRTVRELHDLRGLIHAHSPYSHDACDANPRPDGGDIDRSCLADFRRGLCQAGHDFVFLTDHPDSFERTDFVDALLFDAAQGDTLELEGGRPVANHLACPDGHAVLVLAGTESDMMPVGLPAHLGDTPAARHVAYSVVEPDPINHLRDAGALVIIQHTEQWTPTQLVSLPIDGFEMYNLHNNAVLNAGYFVDLLANLTTADFTGLPHPDLTLALLRDIEQPKYLNTWGSVLARGAKRVTTMGTDCHRNTFPQLLADGERIDSYRRMMRMFSNHLLVRGEPSRATLLEALKARRLYGVFEVLGYAAGFDYHAEVGGALHEQGAAVPVGAELVVTLPQVAQLDPAGPQPVLRARIVKAVEGGWLEVATGSSSLRYRTTGPGAYRAEVRMVPKHLGPWLADSLAVASAQRPWVYANAIDVE